MKITVTVIAKLESDNEEEGMPVAEQTFHRVELEPTRWATAVADLGQAALTNVSRMVAAAVSPDPLPLAPGQLPPAIADL